MVVCHMYITMKNIKIRKIWNLARKSQVFVDRKKKLNKKFCRIKG